MKIARISLVLIFVCAVHAQSTKMAKIQEIFKITNMEALQKKTVDQLTASVTAQMKRVGGSAEQTKAMEAQRQILQLVVDRMAWPKVEALYIKAYDETFTDEEISGLLLFYRSPAGKAYIQKTPTLTGKMIAISQQRVQEIMPEIRKKTEELQQSGKH